MGGGCVGLLNKLFGERLNVALTNLPADGERALGSAKY